MNLGMVGYSPSKSMSIKRILRTNLMVIWDIFLPNVTLKQSLCWAVAQKDQVHVSSRQLLFSSLSTPFVENAMFYSSLSCQPLPTHVTSFQDTVVAVKIVAD